MVALIVFFLILPNIPLIVGIFIQICTLLIFCHDFFGGGMGGVNSARWYPILGPTCCMKSTSK